MTDAGFFRGTSADQDNRFANKQKKLLKELNFSPILNTKLNMSKIELDSLKPWVEQKIIEILEKDDDILSDSVYEYLKEKEPDGKGLLVLITGFVDEIRASKFVEELWTKLIDLQNHSNGVSPKVAETSSPGGNGVPPPTKTPTDNEQIAAITATTKDDQPAVAGDAPLDRTPRSRSRTPPSKTNSQPRSRSHSHSRSRSPSKKSDSGSKSKTPSKSGSKSPSGSRSRSRSTSRSKSRSKSSRSRSPSHSRSRSKSTSRSPRRSRSRSHSPHYRSQRYRRSRSRSGSYRRRSRSPRGRRGFGGRSSYRGLGYDRRRGPVGPPRRRSSPPWSRRRFSPAPSPPVRRRRSPSPMSPRRRSRSPYYRRRNRSRSPPYGHMMGRRSPRPHTFGPDFGPRPVLPHRDIQRPMLTGRSPHMGPMDHRGFSDAPMLPRHSPGNVMVNRQHDLPLVSHTLPGPSKPPYSPKSPSSGRKKHKKEKKHRKHKKSKRHRSATPEKRKKHKKHKKTKKHKS